MMHLNSWTGHPVMMLLVAALVILPAWRICFKAGYPGWLALLFLLPIANLVLLYFLAFAEWPLERRAASGPTVVS
jgi:hypothetical protein